VPTRTINDRVADATLKHAHNIAYLERDALEAFTESVLAAWDAQTDDNRVPGREELAQLVRQAMAAGRSRLRMYFIEIVLVARRAIGGVLAKASGGLLTEGLAPLGILERIITASPLLQRAGVHAPMTRERAEGIVDGLMRDKRSVFQRYDLDAPARRRLGEITTEGFSKGRLPREIMSDVRDALGTERHYETFARTVIQEVNAKATDTLIQDNQDVLNGVQYMASLDDHTCLVCAAADGRSYWFDRQKGQDSYESRPRVPQHFRCRCTYVPTVKSLRELGISRKEVPDKVARQMTGGPSQGMTYSAWLSKQAEATQQAILGRGRFEMYKRGVPIDRFTVGRNITTLDDLERLADAGIKAREVAIPKVAGRAADLAQQGLRSGEARYVAARAHPFASEPGLEMLGPKVSGHMEHALENLPPAAREQARMRYVQKARYTKTAEGAVKREAWQVAQVTGLNAPQLEAAGRRLIDMNVGAELRVRGAKLGWRKRYLNICKTESGYLERLAGQRMRGGIKVEVFQPSMGGKVITKPVPTPKVASRIAKPRPKPKVTIQATPAQQAEKIHAAIQKQVVESTDYKRLERLRRLTPSKAELKMQANQLSKASTLKGEIAKFNRALTGADPALLKQRGKTWLTTHDKVFRSRLAKIESEMNRFARRQVRRGSAIRRLEKSTQAKFNNMTRLSPKARMKIDSRMDFEKDFGKAARSKARTAAWQREMQTKVDDAATWMEQHVIQGEGLKAGQTSRIATHGMSHTKAGKRVRAYHRKGEIWVSRADDTSKIIHEMGHAIEEMSPKRRQLAKEFLARRTEGDTAKRLSAIRPGQGYNAAEMAKPDKFFDPYCGTIYEHEATELVSMGMERMYKDAARFALEDPDYFKFVLQVARTP